MKTVTYQGYLFNWLNIVTHYKETYTTPREDKVEIVAQCYARAARRFYPKGLLKTGVMIKIFLESIK